MQVVEAQPHTVFPRSASTTAQIIPIKLMNATIMPNELYRLYGKAGDPVKRQGEHFFQRVMRLPGGAFAALVVHAGALESHKRHHSAQEDVYLPEFCQLLERAAAYQPVIRMVVHDLRAMEFSSL